MSVRVSLGLSTSERSRKKTPGMWPTPTSEDGESKGMSAKRLASRGPDNLNSAVKMWPTPSGHDWRSGRGRSPNGHTPQPPEAVGGQLNPAWVEMLMGLPEGWTELLPGNEMLIEQSDAAIQTDEFGSLHLGMPSSHRSRS
jgi:hypothetical protein